MIDPDLLQAVRRLGIQTAIVHLQNYARSMGDRAWETGLSGLPWYDLHDALDDAQPDLSDTEMDGEVRL
jgi:hypothetical protein